MPQDAIVTGQGLHHRVLAELGPALAAGDHPAGTVLRIDELAARFTVSRTVVREAVRVLESMGVVSSRRRVGITVRPKAEWNLLDPLVIRWRLAGPDRAGQLRSLNELRAAVEPVAAAGAAEHAGPEQCGELTGIVIHLVSTAKARDLAAFLRYDIAFHRLVLDASGNEMFARLGDVVAEVLTGRTHHHLMPAQPAAEALRLHAEVAEAIQSGEPDRAEAAMRAIVVRARAEISEAFTAQRD